MDRFQGMEVFIRVAEAGSFTAVAERLGLARSAVTRLVAALEAHLGVKLIARSTRSLRLTAEGEVYLERCREILDLVGAAEGDLSGDQRTPRGPIRISVPVSFGVRHLTPLLADFAAAYPLVTLDMDFSDRQVNLIEGGLDMAIRISTQLDPSQVARRISSARMLTVAAPDYLGRHGRPAAPGELTAHQCLGYTGTSRSSWPYRIGSEMVWIPVTCRLQANSGEALMELAQRGLGIVRQPSFIAAPAVKAGLVDVILADYAGPELGIYALYPSHRYLPSRVRLLTDFLIDRIGPAPYWEEGLA